jgi:hypothetical protein
MASLRAGEAMSGDENWSKGARRASGGLSVAKTAEQDLQQ